MPPERVGLVYDHLSDTLFVDLAGSPTPAVSIPTDIGSGAFDVYLRLDPVSEEVVGLQIEGVLAAHKRPPWLREALVAADLRDIEPEALPNWSGPHASRRAAVVALLDALVPVTA